MADDIKAREDAILAELVDADGMCREVLFSDLTKTLGIQAGDEAFEGLRQRGTIRAYFPEAVPGNSGRQFWGMSFRVYAGNE